MARRKRKSLKSRLRSFIKEKGVNKWDRGLILFAIAAGGITSVLLACYSLFKGSVWNWVLLAMVIIWMVLSIRASTLSSKKYRIAGNTWTSDQDKATEKYGCLGMLLAIPVIATLILDFLDVINVLPMAKTTAWMGDFAINSTKGITEVVLYLLGIVLAFVAGGFALYGLYLLIMFIRDKLDPEGARRRAEAEEERRRQEALHANDGCQDVILLLIVNGIVAIYLSRMAVDYLLSMI